MTSLNFIETLDTLEGKFIEIVDRVASSRQCYIQSVTRDQVLRYQGELAQLAGDLDKFQVIFNLCLAL